MSTSVVTVESQALPTITQLLVAGGDARIAVDWVSGKNKYGCEPHPNKNIAAFGSATASTVSERAYLAAEELRCRLACSLAVENAATVYADEMQRLRQELMQLCELESFPGLDMIFAASGTDCHLLAAQLASVAHTSVIRMLMVGEAETGSGVPNALSGERSVIPLRTAQGLPREIADIDADFERQVVAAAALGQQVLLTMVDVSKTGLIAPSVASVIALRERYPDVVDVLVDACQLRMASPTLHAYLSQGFMLAMTGSKFMSGPSFSGVLLIPAVLAKKYRTASLNIQQLSKSNRAEWPVDWLSAQRLSETSNFGLLLRWQAALHEMRAFLAITPTLVHHFLLKFAEAVTKRLQKDSHFELLVVPALQREPFTGELSWDQVQTIFPFVLRHADNRYFSREETEHVYRALQKQGVQLAQPVPCGERDGVAVSALRLCVSSRLVVEALQDNGKQEQVVIHRALAALDQAVQLVSKLKTDRQSC
jgi:hypothetical protein